MCPTIMKTHGCDDNDVMNSNWLRQNEGLLLNTIIVLQLKSAVSFPHYVLCLKDVLVDRILQRQRGDMKTITQMVDEPLPEFAERTVRMTAGGYSGMGGESIQIAFLRWFNVG